MNAPRFPRRPDLGKRPFEDGKNPFADADAARQSDSERGQNAYVAHVVNDRPPNREVPYEAVLPNRSRSILILGVTGAVMSAVSVIMGVLAINSTDWVEGMFYGLPISLTSVAFTIPAWWLAQGDMRAIRAGAMDPGARRGTRIAYWLGCLGTLVGLFPAIGGLVALILSF